MTWDVEYTDEFGDWWQSLTEAEQESLAASVQLLELRGRRWGIRTAAASMALGMGICGSCVLNTRGDRIERCTLLTRAGWRFC